MKILITITLLFSTLLVKGQKYPSYGPEISVTINGSIMDTLDAMEPFISPDGSTLFFNNLNDNVYTRLYYASYVNDSTFTFVGALDGTNQLTPPHLDGIADLDSFGNFYWTSTRNYGAELETLFHGKYANGKVTSIGRLHGSFNKNIPGWILLDHGVSYSGQHMVYSNARFETNKCQGGICDSEMGMSEKVNDSTFNKMANSDSILKYINDTNFILYAPCLTSDELELYYTRYRNDSVTLNTVFEICVAVRNTTTENFSIPKVLFSETFKDLIEAPTLTANKQVIYYHRKVAGSPHKIVMRYRQNPLGTTILTERKSHLSIYPNPANSQLNITTTSNYHTLNLTVLSLLGEQIIARTNQTQIDISSLANGTYLLQFEIDGETGVDKFIKIE